SASATARSKSDFPQRISAMLLTQGQHRVWEPSRSSPTRTTLIEKPTRSPQRQIMTFSQRTPETSFSRRLKQNLRSSASHQKCLRRRYCTTCSSKRPPPNNRSSKLNRLNKTRRSRSRKLHI